MYYLVTMGHQGVEGQEYIQSTTRFDDIDAAKTAWHTACASYRNKETTLSFTSVILNDLGQPMPGLNDHYTKLVPVTEAKAEPS